jgi:hypothetical protein
MCRQISGTAWHGTFGHVKPAVRGSHVALLKLINTSIVQAVFKLLSDILLAISYFTHILHTPLTSWSVYNNYNCFSQVHLSPTIHTNFKPDIKKLSSNKRCDVYSKLSDQMSDTRTVPTGQSKSDFGPVHTSVISSGELAAASYLRLGKPRCIDPIHT